MTTTLLDLKGIGEKGLLKLKRIGINSVEDLLFHLPIRYQDKTRLTKISDAEIGKKYFFEGIIEKANVIFYQKRMYVVKIRDESSSLQLRFFYFNAYRVFDEVLNNVNQIVQRQLSPLPVTMSQIAARADTVSTCSSNSQCSVNGSKRKCWFGNNCSAPS